MSSRLNVKPPRIKGTIDIRKTWRLILLIGIYVTVLLINGLDEFLRSGFNIELLFTPEWWYRVFRVLISNMFIFVGTFLYLLDLAMRKRESVLAKKDMIESTVSGKLDPVTFDPFFLDFERNRKIEFYKKSMQSRLEALDSKAKIQDMDLWYKSQQNYDENDNPKNEELHKEFMKNKFCIKKQTILKQLDPEFIQKHIGYMKVKYRPNSKSFVTNGYNKPSTKYDDYAVEPRTSKLVWDLTPKFIIMIGFLVALESLLVEFIMTDSWLVTGFNIVRKILPLLLQIYFAFAYCDIYLEEKVMVDYNKREDILTLYIASLKKGVEPK